MIDTVDLSSIDKFLEATDNYYRVFQIVLRGGMGNFDGGGDFLSGGGNLRSDFDHSILFQNKKQHSVNIEH